MGNEELKELSKEVKYRKQWDESQNAYKACSGMSELFCELVKARTDRDSATEKFNDYKSMIGNILKRNHLSRVVSLETGYQVTISKHRNAKTYNFDLDKFKREHPELYKEYLVPTPYTSYGGALTVTKIPKMAMKFYKRFSQKQEG